MKRNDRIPKLTIIAEDKATSDIAQGFIGNSVACRQSRCNIIHYAKGFSDAVEMVKSLRLDVQNLDYVVVVIDYDNRDVNRFEQLRQKLSGLPQRDRIFLLGSREEAEKLRGAMREYFHDPSLTLEGVGHRIAQECYEGTKPTAWETESLDINFDVVWRLEKYVKPFLMNR